MGLVGTSSASAPATEISVHTPISAASAERSAIHASIVTTPPVSQPARTFLRIGEVTTSPHKIQLHQVSVQTHITLVFTSFKHHHPRQSTSCPVSLLSTYLGVRARSPPLFSWLAFTAPPPSVSSGLRDLHWFLPVSPQAWRNLPE